MASDARGVLGARFDRDVVGSDRLLLVACSGVLLAYVFFLIRTFWHGFDLTDEAYYLYSLMHPRTEAPFSGFSALISPFGSLFGHHVVGYRLLGLAFGSFGAVYLALGVAAVLRQRLETALPIPLAVSLALLAASVHQAILPTLSYNDSMMLGTSVMAGGLAHVLAGPMTRRSMLWHGAIVALGTALALQARSVTALAIAVGIAVVAIPTARCLGFIQRAGDAKWLLTAFTVGTLFAIASAFLLGNLPGLINTQALMLREGGGIPTYTGTLSMGAGSLWKYAVSHFSELALAAFAACATLFLTQSAWRGLAGLISLLLLGFAFTVAAQSGTWRDPAAAYFFASLIAGAIFVAQTAIAAPASLRLQRLNLACVIVLMLLTLPLIGSLGTSNNIAHQAVLNLGPLGLLIALPLASPTRPTFSALPGLAIARWGVVPTLIVVAIATLNIREHHPYRVEAPLSQREILPLSIPGQLSGIMVSSKTHAHLAAVADFFSREAADVDTARVLALYRSPGTVVASGLPALGLPWVFTHVSDATFNCPLIEYGAVGQPSKLYIIENDELRPEIVTCLDRLGYGSPSSWRPRGCVPITTAKSTLPRKPETCIFEARRAGNTRPPGQVEN